MPRASGHSERLFNETVLWAQNAQGEMAWQVLHLRHLCDSPCTAQVLVPALESPRTGCTACPRADVKARRAEGRPPPDTRAWKGPQDGTRREVLGGTEPLEEKGLQTTLARAGALAPPPPVDEER